MNAWLLLHRGTGRVLAAIRRLAAIASPTELEVSQRLRQINQRLLQEETARIERIARRVFAEEFAETKEQLARLQRQLNEIQKTSAT